MEKASLVRFVVAGGAIRVDPLATEPGRGAYLCGRAACLDVALRRDAQVLRRALRATDGTVMADTARLRGEVEKAAVIPAERMAGAAGGTPMRSE